jgi:hypothetical protein
MAPGFYNLYSFILNLFNGIMVNRQEDGLKGQLNLAQGIALGSRVNKEIVREKVFFSRMLLFRAKRRKSKCLTENNELQFRPKEVLFLDYQIPSDGFTISSLPQGVALG